MPGFKDLIASDRAIFFNPSEFGEVHKINGQDYTVIIDNDRLQHRSKKEFDGLIVGDTLYYIQADSFTKKPKPDEVQVFDGVACLVFDVREDFGVYEIILKKNVS